MVEAKEKEKKKDTAQEGKEKDKDEKDNSKSKKLSDEDKEKALILWFEDLTNDDVAYVGGKNASLGEMYRELTPKGIKIPNGFAVTAQAYNHFLNECNLLDSLGEALEAHHIESKDLKRVGKRVRKLILEADFPEDLSKAIVEAYRKLGGGDVAVRSSATAEDLPEASFAGQQESYLNVEGEDMVLEACKKCMASLFTNRAISYREDKGFDHFDVYLSVGVMKMVRSDKACAGTMFTIDTETGFPDTIVINGDWGLGENVVQGSVNPDEWTVFKPTLKKDYKSIIRKVLGSKKQFMVYGGEGTTSTVNMETSEEHRGKFCLEDDEVLQLAKWGIIIEDHYSKRKGKKCPMDIEWAKDGNTNEIFIVQARPETVQSQKNLNKLVTYKLKGKREVDEESLEEATEENAKELKKEKGGDDKGADKAKQKLGRKGDNKKQKGDKEKSEKKEDKDKGDNEEKEAKEGKKKGKESKEDEKEGKKSYKKPKKRSKGVEEEDEEDSGDEDDLKLKTRKKHKSEEKEDNELINEAEKEGKGEAKGEAKDDESKDKGDESTDKDKEKEKEDSAKGKGKEEKDDKGKDEKEKEGKEKGDEKEKEGKVKEEKEKEDKGKGDKEKEGERKGGADAGKIAMKRHEEFSKDKGEKEAKEKKRDTKGGEKEGEKKKKGKEEGEKEKGKEDKGEENKEKKEKGKEKEEKGEEKEKGEKGKEKGDKGNKASSEHNEKDEKILTSGAAVGSGIAAGKARNILNVSSLKEFNKGEILVTEMTDPDWEPILKLAAAIITDSGGRTCHAAIIARELGIPCIVGCSDATSKINTDDAVTVDCARGDQGVVLEGLYDFEKTEQDLGDLTETKTKIMMNVANPDRALELSFIPNSGVGLGRLEFIVNNHIGIHPIAALHPDDLEEDEKEKMLEKARGYEDPRDFFVSTLAHGVGTIAAAFYPKPVIVRFSDFKTNEYANLLGGKHYEPKEDNPMLGWRGAARYYDPTYREAFALECEAMKRVREKFGLINLRLMIPMLRTVDEAKRVLAEMEKNGIKKSEGEEGLKVMAMCEVPANCILAEQFLELLDGFSIGSNDLTQMTLGVDRDSEIVNDIFDERNEAVKAMIAHAIKVCRKLKKYVGICGQAPSDYPEFAKWLVDQGIESMSLNPDTVLPTTLLVSQRERGLSDEEIEKENKEKQKKAEEKAKEEEKEKEKKEKKSEKKGEKKEGEDGKKEKGGTKKEREEEEKKKGEKNDGKEKDNKEEKGKKKGKEKEGKEKEEKEEKGKAEKGKGKEDKGKREGKDEEGKREGKEKEGKEEGKEKGVKEKGAKEKEGKEKEGNKKDKEEEREGGKKEDTEDKKATEKKAERKEIKKERKEEGEEEKEGKEEEKEGKEEEKGKEGEEKGKKIEEIHKQLDEISEKVGELSDELHQLSGEKTASGQPAL